jgi:hypothetical protein
MGLYLPWPMTKHPGHGSFLMNFEWLNLMLVHWYFLESHWGFYRHFCHFKQQMTPPQSRHQTICTLRNVNNIKWWIIFCVLPATELCDSSSYSFWTNIDDSMGIAVICSKTGPSKHTLDHIYPSWWQNHIWWIILDAHPMTELISLLPGRFWRVIKLIWTIFPGS